LKIAIERARRRCTNFPKLRLCGCSGQQCASVFENDSTPRCRPLVPPGRRSAWCQSNDVFNNDAISVGAGLIWEMRGQSRRARSRRWRNAALGGSTRVADWLGLAVGRAVKTSNQPTWPGHRVSELGRSLSARRQWLQIMSTRSAGIPDLHSGLLTRSRGHSRLSGQAFCPLHIGL
jgi:hypothetical protein